MEEKVILSVDRYNELLRKAFAYDTKREDLIRWGVIHESDRILFNIPQEVGVDGK